MEIENRGVALKIMRTITITLLMSLPSVALGDEPAPLDEFCGDIYVGIVVASSEMMVENLKIVAKVKGVTTEEADFASVTKKFKQDTRPSYENAIASLRGRESVITQLKDVYAYAIGAASDSNLEYAEKSYLVEVRQRCERMKLDLE